MNWFNPRNVEATGFRNPPLEKGLSWVIVGFLALLAVVLFLAEVNAVASAQARLVASSKSRPIQSIYGGRITLASFKPLQKVQKDDLLFELDNTDLSTDIAKQSSEAAEYKATDTRLKLLREQFLRIQGNPLKAQLAENPFDNEGHLDPLLISSYRALRDRVLSLRKKYEAYEQQSIGLAAQNDQLSLAVESSANRLISTKRLTDSGFISRAELMKEEENHRRLKREQLDVEFKKAELNSHFQEIVSDIRAVVSEALKALDERHTENNLRLNNMQKDLTKLQHNLQQERLRAPVGGTIQEIRPPGIGTVVKAGEVIAWVAPENELVEIEIQISNTDIGFVHSGQQAVIKLDTYPFEKYGTISGRVIRVGSDSIYNEATGWTYPAIVVPDQTSMVIDGTEHPLRIGETGRVDIILRKRRLIDFFLEPVFKYTSQTFETR